MVFIAVIIIIKFINRKLGRIMIMMMLVFMVFVISGRKGSCQFYMLRSVIISITYIIMTIIIIIKVISIMSSNMSIGPPFLRFLSRIMGFKLSAICFFAPFPFEGVRVCFDFDFDGDGDAV
jgi:hypothetical protein